MSSIDMYVDEYKITHDNDIIYINVYILILL